MSNDQFALTTPRVKEAVARALYSDFKIEHTSAERLFTKWLDENTGNSCSAEDGCCGVCGG